jgi:hypothetical protein
METARIHGPSRQGRHSRRPTLSARSHRTRAGAVSNSRGDLRRRCNSGSGSARAVRPRSGSVARATGGSLLLAPTFGRCPPRVGAYGRSQLQGSPEGQADHRDRQRDYRARLRSPGVTYRPPRSAHADLRKSRRPTAPSRPRRHSDSAAFPTPTDRHSRDRNAVLFRDRLHSSARNQPPRAAESPPESRRNGHP